jgi:hypothetical protein
MGIERERGGEVGKERIGGGRDRERVGEREKRGR